MKLDWTGYESQREADPIVVAEREHGQVHFLDLDMWAEPAANAEERAPRTG